MFSPHGITLFKAGDAACFCEIRLGTRCVKHHDHAVGSGTLLVPKHDRIFKALQASVRVLAMLGFFGIPYLATLQDFWQDMFCKGFVFSQVFFPSSETTSAITLYSFLFPEAQGVGRHLSICCSVLISLKCFSCRSQLPTEWVSFSTVRSNKEQSLASEQANLQVELCSSFSVTIIWSLPVQSVGFSCVALLLISWTAALAAVHCCIQECVWKFVVFPGEEFRKQEALLYAFWSSF